MNKILCSIFGVVLLVSGCSTTITSGDENFKMVTQQPLQITSAEFVSRMGLGFVWSTGSPDTLILQPKVRVFTTFVGKNISALSFEADGRVIETELIDIEAPYTSYKMALADFQGLLSADKVLVRITLLGETHEELSEINKPDSVIGGKIGEFMEEVATVKSEFGLE